MKTEEQCKKLLEDFSGIAKKILFNDNIIDRDVDDDLHRIKLIQQLNDTTAAADKLLRPTRDESDYIKKSLLLKQLIHDKGLYVEVFPGDGKWFANIHEITKPNYRECYGTDAIYDSYEAALAAGLE